MVLFFFCFLVNVVQIKVGGFEYTFVCIVTITYYLLNVDFCSCSFWSFVLVVWALYGRGMAWAR